MGKWKTSPPERVLIAETVRRFLAMVDLDADGGHWMWTGSVRSGGYGQFSYQGKIEQASRVAWLLFRGDIPEGKIALHLCDRPGHPEDVTYRRCVNPAHIYLGSHLDNSHDRATRKRSRVGEGHYKARFTEQDILDIRAAHADGEGSTAIARRYGVRNGHICQIVSRKIWKHI